MPGIVKGYNFDGEPLIVERQIPFVNTAANADLAQLGGSSGVARAYWRVPRAGTLTEIAIFGEDGITQHGTNFQTFTALNLGPTGTGDTSLLVTTAHHNTTDINAAALNGGSNLTAKVPYPLELHAASANMAVAEGDVLEVTATADGTGAVVDAAQCLFKVRAMGYGLKPSVVRIGGASALSPMAIQMPSTGGGEAYLALSATNEAQSARLDWGDQLLLDPTACPTFSCRLKLSAVAANTRACWGLASAYTATLDNIVSNLWFRLEGNSFALLVEGDDGTTDTDDQATSPATTLVAATYATFEIDLSGGLSAVKFKVNGLVVGTVSAPLLSPSTLLQPFVILQKSSGTSAQTMTIDYVAVC